MITARALPIKGLLIGLIVFAFVSLYAVRGSLRATNWFSGANDSNDKARAFRVHIDDALDTEPREVEEGEPPFFWSAERASLK